MTQLRWLIPLRPCQRLGLLQRCSLVRMSGRSRRGQYIIEVKIFGGPAVREPDFVAAGVGHRRVPDDADARN